MRWLLTLCGVLTWSVLAEAGSWPQFRGPGGTGLADSDDKLPAQVGPDRNVLWKVPLPPGHSSPIVHGNRIFLTAVRDGKLLTLALDRGSGKLLWEAEAPHKGLEKIHQIGSHAQATPVTDGSRVISFFGSSGMFCYDTAGKLLWHRPMGPFKNEFGSGSSPILLGDKVILNQDHDSESFLIALDKKTGEVVWRTDRSEFAIGYATPAVWEVGGKKQLVVAGTLRVVGYDLDTGKEIWTVRGLARVNNMTPSVGRDNVLYVCGWAAGADPGERFDVPPFDEMIAKYDRNKNGTLEEDELPKGPLKERFIHIDRDKDGHITRVEWEAIQRIIQTAVNRMVAIKPGGKGDVTETHVLWEQRRLLPYVPSPLYCNGQLFLIRNNGILTALDAKTGEPGKSERLQTPSNYYASPVGGDGKVYLFSQRGDAIVVSAGESWQVLSRARFGEEVFATPAIVEGKIYVRTVGYLFCFGNP
jgi:outer membrane protein assembly factor BamB